MKFTIAICFLLFLISCGDENFNSVYEMDFDDKVEHDKDLVIHFRDVADTRCPQEVTCIVPGYIDITLHLIYEKDLLGTLIMRQNKESDEPVDTVMLGYTIRLLEVLPEENLTEGIPLEDYSIRLLVD